MAYDLYRVDGLLDEDVGLPVDYFDFPISARAFGRSWNSHMVRVSGPSIYFRRRANLLTLITYGCSGSELLDVTRDLLSQGYKFRSLNFVHKDFNCLKTERYKREFWVDHTWSRQAVLESKKSKQRCRLRSVWRRGAELYRVSSFVSEEEVDRVFETWYRQAKERRTDMVVKGHYEQYIEEWKNSWAKKLTDSSSTWPWILGFYEKEPNRIIGIMGFEVCHNRAQVTLFKHELSDYSYPRFAWAASVEIILNLGVDHVFLGSTSDDLKSTLGFQSDMSYKLRLNDV